MFLPLPILYFIIFALFEALNIFSNIWLSNLFEDKDCVNDIKIMFNDYSIMQEIALTISTNKSLTSSDIIGLQNANTSLANNLTSAWIDLCNHLDYYLFWYFGFGGIQAILVASFCIIYSFMVTNASKHIHSKMLGNKNSF